MSTRKPMPAAAITWLIGYDGADQPHAATRMLPTVIGHDLKIYGIRSTIPADAKIIQGGLSSPFWLEADGDCGLPGIRIEPPDPRK